MKKMTVKQLKSKLEKYTDDTIVFVDTGCGSLDNIQTVRKMDVEITVEDELYVYVQKNFEKDSKRLKGVVLSALTYEELLDG